MLRLSHVVSSQCCVCPTVLCLPHVVSSQCCVCPTVLCLPHVVSALCCVCPILCLSHVVPSHCSVCPTVLCLPHSCQTHRGASEAEKALQNQSHYEQNEDEERVKDIGCLDVARLSEVTCLLPEPPPANLQRKRRKIEGREEERGGRRNGDDKWKKGRGGRVKEKGEVGKGRELAGFCEMVQSHSLTTFKKTEFGLITNLWHVRRALTTCAVWKGDWRDREEVGEKERVGEGWGRVRKARKKGGERGWSVGEEGWEKRGKGGRED